MNMIILYLLTSMFVYGGTIFEVRENNILNYKEVQRIIQDFPDPCTQKKDFGDVDKRSPSYVLTDEVTSISDYKLQAGWYGLDSYQIPTIPSPGINHCGAKIPAYFKVGVEPINITDKLPDLVSKSSESIDINIRKLCLDSPQFESGVYSMDMIEVTCKNTNSYVYLHYQNYILSDFFNFAYCLDSAAYYSTSVSVNIPNLVEENGQLQYRFQCQFELSNEDLWYMVMWYIDNKLLVTYPSLNKTSNILEETTLHENQLGSVTAGFKIRCGYNAGLTKDANITIRSPEMFIGIEILTPMIQVSGSNNAEIIIQPSVPIGCLISEPDCILKVNIETPQTSIPADPCEPSSSFSGCGISVSGVNWNQTFKLAVAQESAIKYGKHKSVNVVSLKTTASFPAHRFWQNYDIGNITISSGYDTTKNQGNSCYAVCDPHMKTFTGQHYEHQVGGLFTLYENKLYKQEIQIKTEPCGTRRFNNGGPQCVCGVAVRAGKEVFVMDHCEPLKYWSIGFTQCSDTQAGLMDIKRSSSQYEIRLPSGTTFQTNVHQANKFLNVYVYPSEGDLEAGGLCGKLNDKRFLTRENTVSVKVGRDVPAFSESWKVNDTMINLFSEQIKNLESVSGGDEGSLFCKCSTPTGSTESQFSCEKKPEGCSINIGNFQPVSECKVGTISKRSAPNHLREKRSTYGAHRLLRRGAGSVPWGNGWTPQTAADYCRDLFANSSIVQKCKTVPFVDTKNPEENCILDIQLMGDSSFAIAAIDTILNKCIHEVIYDTSLHKAAAPGEASVLDQIKDIACPSECSFRGTCTKGVCECIEGFGGADCSVNTQKPPILDHLTNDGHCDLQHDKCTEISVFGGIFTDMGYCQIKYMHLSEKGVFKEKGERKETAKIESISEIKCPLLSNREKREATSQPEEEFVQVLDISVSNNGIVYSNNSKVVVFNSKCQSCNLTDDTVQCIYTGDYCMSRGECYGNGESHIIHKCYTCSVEGQSRSWHKSSVGDCGEPDSLLWIIGVVVAIVVVLGLVVVLICCIVRKKK